MPSVGTASIDLEVDKRQFGRNITGAIESQRSGVFASAKRLAGVFAGGFAAFKAFDFLKDSVGEAQEAAKVMRQTNAVIASTKGAANIGAEGVSDLATRLSNLAGVDDELIQSGENVLLTFTNIKNGAGKGNDIFNQATLAATNMSAALGTDLQGSIIQVGKALNDPIKGVTALSRVGVSFTEQQKEQIKSLVASGKTMEAQKLILKELSTEFGGAAEAAADPTQKLGVVWGNLKEQVGTAVLPIINKAATWLGEHLPGAIAKAQQVLPPLIDKFKTGFNTVRSVVSTVVTFFQEKLLPVAREVASGVTTQFGKVVDWFKRMWPQISEAVGHVVNFVKTLWKQWGDDLLHIAQAVFGFIKETIQNVLQVVRGIIQTVLAVINGDWGKAWNGIKQIVGAVWKEIWTVIGAAFDVIKGLFGGVASTIGDIWGALWNGLTGVVDRVWVTIQNSVRSGVNFIIDAINGLIKAYNVLPGHKDLAPIAHLLMVSHDKVDTQKQKDTGNYRIGGAYADGGWVTAPKGQPQLAIVHGGEFVLSNRMIEQMRSGNGWSSDDQPVVLQVVMDGKVVAESTTRIQHQRRQAYA